MVKVVIKLQTETNDSDDYYILEDFCAAHDISLIAHTPQTPVTYISGELTSNQYTLWLAYYEKRKKLLSKNKGTSNPATDGCRNS